MQTIPWSRFVAVGDSLTEGVGDPFGGSLRGWADRVAEVLRVLNPELAYWNLARRSLTTAQVRESQLGRALELQPDLASVVAGMNDLLSGSFDAAVYRDELTGIASPLAAAGATILMGTFPADLPVLRLMPRSRAAAFRARLRLASDVVLEVAAEFDALCIGARAGWRYRMVDCSIDGCHPNARGHALIAELAIEALSNRAGVAPAPLLPGKSWLGTSLGHLRWLWAQGYLRRPQSIFRA